MRDDPETARNRHSEGLALARGTGDPRAVALALEGLAGVSALIGENATAARQAAATRESVGAPPPAAERYDVDRFTARAVNTVSARVFDTEFATGNTLVSAKPGAEPDMPPATTRAHATPAARDTD